MRGILAKEVLDGCSSILAGENQLEPSPATMAQPIVQVTRDDNLEPETDVLQTIRWEKVG